MSSVMLAADDAAIEDRKSRAGVHRAPQARTRKGMGLLDRARGVAAGVLFLGLRVPICVAVLLIGALLSLVGAALYLVQAAVLRLTRPAGSIAAAALALVCIAGPQRAKADQIGDASLLQQTTLVFSQQTNLYSFDAPSAGTLTISLKDWNFPVLLQQFTASIMSQDQVLGSWDPSGSTGGQYELQIQNGGLFDAFVAAQAGSFYGVHFGAYSMNIDFTPAATPVPLPPAFDLLLGGMGLLGAVTLVERVSRRRNRDVISLA